MQKNSVGVNKNINRPSFRKAFTHIGILFYVVGLLKFYLVKQSQHNGLTSFLAI